MRATEHAPGGPFCLLEHRHGLAEVLERVENDGIIAIYVEEYTADNALASLVQETVSDDLPEGIDVLTLNTLEMAPADASENYITLMTENLENLKLGLAC